MGRHYQEEIVELNPADDHCRMVFLLATIEFPFDIVHALEFALFRSYAVPRISGLLRSTGELTLRTRKRYDDTDLLLSELIEHGYDSERGMAAIDNMNNQHGRYPIRNEDALYVLSTFMFEPLRWIDRYGYRTLMEKERLSWFYFWRAVGERMGITGIPGDQIAFERFNLDYEARNFRFSRANFDVALCTTDLLLGMYLPRSLVRWGRPLVYALLDPPLLEAFGLEAQPVWLQRLMHSALRLHGRLAAVLPERRKPSLRTRLRRPTYAQGYRIDELGP